MSTGETIDDLAGAAGVRGTSSDDASGALAAQAAYDAGAVEPVAVRPVFEVILQVRVHGPQREAQELGDGIAAMLLDHPLVVDPVTLTVVERQGVVEP